MSKALEQYKQAIMGGYNPTQAISYDNFMDARLGGLLKQMQQTNNLVEENNLMIGAEERKREEEKLAKREARMKALREFGNRMEILAQKRSGNPQIAAALQQQMDARKLAEQQRIEAAQKQQRLNAIYKTLPQEQQRMMDMINAGVPKDVVESYFKKPDAPNSYQEYSLTTNDPSPEGYLAFLNRNIPKEKQPTAKQIYENLAADIKTRVAMNGVESLSSNEKTFYNTYLLRQNTGGFDRFIMDYIRGQGDSNKTANETGIIDTGERTADGKKIVEKDGKRFVQVD
jgi:hypothetical protein